MEIIEINNIREELTDIVNSSTVKLSSGIDYVEQMTPPNGTGLDSMKYETNLKEEKIFSYNAEMRIETENNDNKYEIEKEEHESDHRQLQTIKTEDARLHRRDFGNKSVVSTSTDCYVLLERLNRDHKQHITDLQTIKLKQNEVKEDTSDDSGVKSAVDANVIEKIDSSIILEDSKSSRQRYFLSNKNIDMAKTEGLEVSDVVNLSRIKVSPGTEYMEQTSLRHDIPVIKAGTDSMKYEKEEDTPYDVEVNIETQFKEEIDLEEHELDYRQLQSIKTEVVLPHQKNSDNTFMEYTSKYCYVLLERLNLDLRQCVNNTETIKLKQNEEKDDTSDDFKIRTAKADAAAMKESDHPIILKDTQSNRQGRYLENKEIEMAKTEDIEEVSDLDNISRIRMSSGIEYMEQTSFRHDISVRLEAEDIRRPHIHKNKIEHHKSALPACKVEDESTQQAHFKVTYEENKKHFKCHFCDYNTYRLGYIKRHYTVKHNENAELYECSFCKFKTKVKGNLLLHCRMQHNKKTKWHKCHLCDFKTKYKSNLFDHRLKHDTAENFYCEYCDFKTKCKRYLLRHFTYQHDDTAETFCCEVCGYRTKYKKSFLLHHSLKHDDSAGIFHCEECDFKTKHKYNLLEHHWIKHDDAPEIFHCELCDYKTEIKRNFLCHHKLKHDDSSEIFHCKVCNVKTKHKRSLLRHHKSQHDDSPKMFQCKLCDFRTKYKRNLLRHDRSKHDVAKKFHCEVCGFKTKYKISLWSHHKRKHDRSVKTSHSEL